MELQNSIFANRFRMPNEILTQGILVVEDSVLQRSVIIELLRRLGIENLYEAASGIEALHLLSGLDVPPAIIVADLQMPGMDGIEMIQRLAEDFPDIALIVLSGADRKLLDTLGSMVEACNMTLLAAFAKPLDGERLAESLLRFKPSTKLKTSSVHTEDLSAIDLKRAIRAGQIIPFYQPKISLRTGKVIGFEALARWRDPVKGIIPPSRFIEIAEESDQLKDLTQVILDSVLADMTAWNLLEVEPEVSINLSVTLMEDRHFTNHLIRSVTNANINPKKIILEITESALMKDRAIALANIGRLKLKGFNFSIDDYGTGFSSMQQLSRIAFNELKIDKSFVTGATDNLYKSQLLQSAIDLGKKLGLITVAEGVETLAELHLLKNLGCDQVQGYLFAKPMPVGDVFPWLYDNAQRIEKLCN